MKNRKVACIFTFVLLITSLAACGEQKAETNVVSDTQIEESTSGDAEKKANSSTEGSPTDNEKAVTSAGTESSTAGDKDTSTNSGTETSSSSPASGETAQEENKPKIVDKTWEYHVDISWIDVEKPMVALSFDDGPVYSTGENSTAIRIQDALSENGMHATFFYWGTTLNGITQREIERAYELGFELGNHTKTHADLSKLTSAEEIEKEVSYMDKKLAEIANQEYFLVRPPYLGVSQRVKDTLKAPLITCGIDTKDWNNASTQQIIDTIVSAAESGTLNGQIVLMHETYTTTAEAVEYLVPYLKEAGYQVVSISEMFCARGKTMAGGKVFTSCSK